MEVLHADTRRGGTVVETDAARFGLAEIRILYERADYPLPRREPSRSARSLLYRPHGTAHGPLWKDQSYDGANNYKDCRLPPSLRDWRCGPVSAAWVLRCRDGRGTDPRPVIPRLSSTMILPIAFGRTTARQVVTIDPQDLEAALARDARPAADRDDVTVEQEPVEDGGRNHGVAEHGARFADVAVRSDQRCTDAAQPSP